MFKILSHYRRHRNLKYVMTTNHEYHFQCVCGAYLTMWSPFA